MCGIVAGRRRNDLVDVVLDGLRRLEYRGYDSSGIAVLEPGGPLQRRRRVGRLTHLEAELSAHPPQGRPTVGVGHTRWATHGSVEERNAHPHTDCTGRIALVHNGIIENAAELAAELVVGGHRLGSDVDSEVVVHLVEDEVRRGHPLPDAVRRVTDRLRGSWALAVVAEGQDLLVLTAHRSPLVVGTGPEGTVAASDVVGLLGVRGTVRYLEDGDLVVVGEDVRWSDRAGDAVERLGVLPSWRSGQTDVGEHPDFTAKEIDEQSDAAGELLHRLQPPAARGHLWRDLGLPTPAAVRFLACGSSRHASLVAAHVLRTLAGVRTETVVASEAVHHPAEPGTLVVAVSQSGETADVLCALEDVHGPVLALTNSASSTLARRSDAVLDLGIGPELGVAATKTFTAQVLAGTALALSAAASRNHLPGAVLRQLNDELSAAPAALRNASRAVAPLVPDLAATLTTATGFLFVARGAALPYAAEGALKLEELTYRWAQCYPSGELKHGPIALVEPGTPVVVVENGAAALDTVVHEVQARGARVLRVGWGEGCTFPVLDRPEPHPWGPLESVVALQHLARGLARALDLDVDRPRNLAKSVTVV